MPPWKFVGFLGPAAAMGAATIFNERQTFNAESSTSDAIDVNQSISTAARERLQTPEFDTDGSQIRAVHRETVPPFAELQLRNVQSFFRHGARTPLRILTFLDQPEWPKGKLLGDPVHKSLQYVVTDFNGQSLPVGPYETMYQKTVLKGGTPVGQLTMLGKQQMYDLGLRYRRDYIEERQLVRPIFSAQQISIRSTNMKRTIESAQWVLSGMFGGNRRGDQVIILAEPAEKEILYPNHSFCLRLKSVNKRIFKALDEIPGLQAHRTDLQKALDYKEDANNKKKLSYLDLRDEYVARQAHGIPVPEKISKTMEQIELYAVKMLNYMVTGAEKRLGDDILRLSCGPVLRLIRDNIDSSLSQEDYYRIQLYSCHDSMLMALLVALKIFDEKWPPFAADLVFETYEDRSGDAWVRVLYLGQTKFLPGNGEKELISLDQFKALIAPYTITLEDYREKCQAARYIDEDFTESNVRPGKNVTVN